MSSEKICKRAPALPRRASRMGLKTEQHLWTSFFPPTLFAN